MKTTLKILVTAIPDGSDEDSLEYRKMVARDFKHAKEAAHNLVIKGYFPIIEIFAETLLTNSRWVKSSRNFFSIDNNGKLFRLNPDM